VGAVSYRLAMPGTLFLLRFTDTSPEGDRRGEPFQVYEVAMSGSGQTIPAKVYEPMNGHDRAMLLVHGVHWGGFDEPRLIYFAKRLAAMGIAVVTPDMADLKNYEIVPDSVDDIESAALWLLREPDLVAPKSDGKIGLIGISFSGGLCLSAAARPALEGRVACILSFGGHADLDRTMEYLATGLLPSGETLPPHVYGQAVLLRKFAGELVPAEEVVSFRQALLTYLHDRFSQVRSGLGRLGPESQRLVRLCLARDTDELGKILLPHVRSHRAHPVLSPANGEPPTCPVFLLHGSVDNVIPPSETIELEKWASASTKTTALVSALIQHVELEEEGEQHPLIEYWKVIRFWTELLRS
jgi:dienelactone hydrolase